MIPLIALLLGQVGAGSASAAPAGSTRPRVVFTLGVERRAEHVRYHFDNASNFDTAQLVPHFFEQQYDASNTWIVVGAEYELARAAARTEIAFAPRRVTAGSDLDTFFDPSGDVIVSGTDGSVSLGSISLSQRFGITRWRAWTVGVTAAYRRSRADFAPDDVIVTHTRPPSTTRTFTTDRETTTSQVIESGFVADARWTLGAGWRLRAAVDALPLTHGHLTVSLPDKYPEDVNAAGLGFGARGRLSVERTVGPITLGGGLTLDGAWSYRPSAAYDVKGAGVVVFVSTPR